MFRDCCKHGIYFGLYLRRKWRKSGIDCLYEKIKRFFEKSVVMTLFSIPKNDNITFFKGSDKHTSDNKPCNTLNTICRNIGC